MRKSIIENLGQNVFGASSPEDAAVRGNMNFDVALRPAMSQAGYPLRNHFEIYREDLAESPSGFFGVVKQKYTPVQNLDMLSLGFGLAGASEDRSVQIESVGAIDRGRKCFALYNLDQTFDIAPGDLHRSFIGQTWSHDGGSAAKTFIIILRDACANTIPAAFRRGQYRDLESFVIRHTKSALERLNAMRSVIEAASESVADVQEKLRALSERNLDRKHADLVAELLLPKPPENAPDSSKTRRENRRNLFLDLFENNDGSRGFALVKNTAYSAYNAYTEMIDHFVPVVKTSAKEGYEVEEIRSERALFGTGAEDKITALDKILDATKFCKRTDKHKTFSFSPLLGDVLDNTRLAA